MNDKPIGLEFLNKESRYLKPSKLKEGDNKIRIVDGGVLMWKYWENDRPVIIPMGPRHQRPKLPKIADVFNPGKMRDPVQDLWSLYIWDYSKEGLYILEVSQSSLMSQLKALSEDADLNGLTGQDIKINYQKSSKPITYGIKTLPPGPLSPTIAAALKANPVRMIALLEGLDPFTDLDQPEGSNEVSRGMATPSQGSVAELVAQTFGNPVEALRKAMVSCGLDGSLLESYLKFLSNTKGQTEDFIARSVMDQRLTEKFKGAYKKFLDEHFAPIAKAQVA